MTNLRKILLIPALIVVSVSSFFSCGVDRWPEYAHLTELDTWMYDIMQQNYLWYQYMPGYDEVNLFQDPATFLSKAKWDKDSYSFVDSVLEAPLPTYGFDYSLVKSQDNDTAYNALITYVIPESPAEKAGLQRGDWIMKVDTSYISKKYETQLLQGTIARELSMGVWKEVEEEPEEGEEVPEEPVMVYKVVPNGVTLDLGAAQSIEDQPVHKYEILTLDNGAKVGYLMYNSFTAEPMTIRRSIIMNYVKSQRYFRKPTYKPLSLTFAITKEDRWTVFSYLPPSLCQMQEWALRWLIWNITTRTWTKTRPSISIRRC